MATTAAARKAARTPIKAGPTPAGYIDRIRFKQPLTEEDLAWQFAYGEETDDQNPSPLELAALRKLQGAQREVDTIQATIAQERKKRGADPDETAGNTGDLTLHDLPYGPTQPPMVPPFLTPNGPTIIYGPGGVGKGMLAVYLARELKRAHITPMVIDYESHRDEWGRRARNMGFTEEELLAIPYKEPFGDEWQAGVGPLIEVAPILREECDRLGVGYIIIDSYAASTSSGDGMGGQAAADEFFAGLRIIQRPALVIAHVTGNAQRFPDKPFGSIYVHNYARETWAVEAATEGTTEIPFDHETNPLQPSVLALELRQKKRNVGKPTPPQFINFSFFHDDHIEVDRAQPAGRLTIADMLASILERSDKPLNVKQFRDRALADFDQKLSKDSAEKTLNRNDERFCRLATSPYTWSLA